MIDADTLKDIASGSLVQQGSPEWFAMRLGKLTASRIADVMAKPRVAGAGMRVNYMWQLACERLTKQPMKTYQSKTMLEAHEWEPIARAAYAFHSDNSVQQVAFVDHNDIANCGCSPDGLIGDEGDGLVEIKCPELTAHMDTLLTGSVPTEYIRQMQFQMACCERKWCDYVSFNADLPENMRVVIVRYPRDVQMISEMEDAARAFLRELDEKVALLREKFPS